MALIASMFALLGVALWGAFSRFLIYGVSVDFGLGVGVGAIVMGTMFAIAYRFDHPKPKQEVIPPKSRHY